jgi:hypothetical protein
MKKVAVTSGQSVSLATDFLGVEIVREGKWVGRDKELNFALVLLNDPHSRGSGEASSHSQDTRVISACKRKMHSKEIFSVLPTALSYHSAPALSSPSPLLPLSAVLPSNRGACDKLRRLFFALLIIQGVIPNDTRRPLFDSQRGSGTHSY